MNMLCFVQVTVPGESSRSPLTGGAGDSEIQVQLEVQVEVRADIVEADLDKMLVENVNVWGNLQAPEPGTSQDATMLFNAIRVYYLSHFTRHPTATNGSSSTSTTTIEPAGLRAYLSVSPTHRPPYCRKIAVGRYYTVKSVVLPTQAHAPVRVVRIVAILSFRRQYWVIVTFMIPHSSNSLREVNSLADAETGLSILCEAAVSSLLLLREVLEPRHVVHRCDGSRGCTTSGAGFDDGAHGSFNEYLDNEHFLW